MKAIPYGSIVDCVAELCEQACYDLSDEMVQAIEKAREAETQAGAIDLLEQILENSRIAGRERIPLCQDTGLTVVFVEQGNRSYMALPEDRPDYTLEEAINDGVRIGYERGLLRKSIVAEPLNQRVNTKINTPAVIHYKMVPGDQMKLTVMAKGGGCENRSAFTMLKPTAGVEAVKDFIVEAVRNAGADACPPFVVGVGVGGTFEKCCQLSKCALTRDLRSLHPDPFYAKIERDLLKRINSLGIGPAGMGGATTALAVLIEVFPCHIASLPVAVNIECHSHRHKSAILS
jgi:fumarate hydratase subunit alpha